MNFPHLKDVISFLLFFAHCPLCKTPFREWNIAVFAAAETECLLGMYCEACDTKSVVNCIFTHEKNTEKKFINVRAKTFPRGRISENEVLDIHNFLNSFSGDVRGLFS